MVLLLRAIEPQCGLKSSPWPVISGRCTIFGWLLGIPLPSVLGIAWIFSNVALGFSVALTPTNLLFCFMDRSSALVGVLPGLGPVGAVASPFADV
jgi:hypothetical protein